MNTRAITRLFDGLPNDPYSIAAASFQADRTYNGRLQLLNRAAGIAVTLPRALGSGTWLWYVVQTVSTTSPYYTLATSPSTDIFQGSLDLLVDATSSTPFKTASNSNKLTFNGTTTGGVSVGDLLMLFDMASGIWAVTGALCASGSVATPFSHV